jgi:hypothetical protein
MRQMEERHVANQVDLMVWSNRLDLLALSNFKGSYLIETKLVNCYLFHKLKIGISLSAFEKYKQAITSEMSPANKNQNKNNFVIPLICKIRVSRL